MNQKHISKTKQVNDEKLYRMLMNLLPEGVSITQDWKIVYVNQSIVKMMGYNSAQEMIGQNMFDLIVENHRNTIKSRLLKRIKGDDLSYTDLELIRKDGSILPARGISFIIDYHGKPAIMSSVRDITTIKKIENQLKESEEKFRKVIQHATDGIMIIDNRGKVTLINEACTKIMGINQKDSLNKYVWDVMHSFLPKKRRNNQVKQLNQQMTLEFLKNGQPAWDAQNRIMPIIRRDGKKRMLEQSVFPIEINNKIYGVSIIKDITNRTKAEKLLKSLPNRILKATELERHHLARELHDSIIQDLPTLKMQLQTITQDLDLNKSKQTELNQILNQIDNMSSDARSLIQGLHPSALDDIGLIEAIEELCQHISRIYQLKITTKIIGLDDLIPNKNKINVFRIVQEALRNIGEHASSTTVKISLTRDKFQTILSIKDNGKGFDIQKTSNAKEGLGITIMQERANLINAGFYIHSKDSNGTTIKIIFRDRNL